MSNDNYPHLWIPNEEIKEVVKTPMAITPDRGLNHSTHGTALSQSLLDVVQAYEHLQDDSLSDEDIVIFQLVLPEGEDVYAKRDIAEKEGMHINAIKDKRRAIVSAERSMFDRLRGRVDNYKRSGRLKHFQYVEEFDPLTVEEKQAASLKKYLAEQQDVLAVDVQMMFVPNLSDDVQKAAAEKLTVKIRQLEGSLQNEPYKLADGTTVIRAMVPVKNLHTLSEDTVVYRVERTSFFGVSPSSVQVFGTDMDLDPDVSIDDLPVVAVLDNGVRFPDGFDDLVPVHWRAADCSGGSHGHGTEVASKVVFSHIGLQLTNSYLTPRAKVVDCDIYGAEEDVPSEVMAARIAEAVANFAGGCKIFNLSTNVNRPIDGDEVSILGYHLDSLMRLYGIRFVISSGNHTLSDSSDTLEEILDDDDIRIAEPADAMLGITVGAVAGIDHKDAFSRANDVAPYSRIGPGFAGFYKPDLVAYGANLCIDPSTQKRTMPRDPFSIVLVPDGKLSLDMGTSFAAPVVAGDLAELLGVVPDDNVLLAQALLYNGAQPLLDTKKMTQEEADYISNQYGRGLSSPETSKYSSSHRVTFLRYGTLKRLVKERVRFLMPSVQAGVRGRNTTRVTITCLTDPPIDKNKGSQYLGAYISASLHKLGKDGSPKVANPKVSSNRTKWDACYHFSNDFSGFSGGDWEVWLDLSTRWVESDDVEVPYALVVTIEDLTKGEDIYSAIINQAAGRFTPVVPVRVEVR